MADRPMLFSPAMVRALLEGRKTQTRRPLKATVPPQPEADCNPRHVQKHAAPYLDSYCGGRRTPENPRGMTNKWCWWQVDDRCCLPQFQVPYVPGDRIWVREGWQTGNSLDGPQIAFRATPDYHQIDAWDGPDHGAGASFNYDRCPGATFDHWLADVLEENGPWRPGIHMPRWASRLTLTITDVRVQRVQEIVGADAEAEGIALDFPGGHHGAYHRAVGAYRDLWGSLNAKRAPWADNPWVAAITFTVEQRNIDNG